MLRPKHVFSFAFFHWIENAHLAAEKGLAGSIGEPLCWGEAFVPRLLVKGEAVRFITQGSCLELLFGSQQICVCSRKLSEIMCSPKRGDSLDFLNR